VTGPRHALRGGGVERVAGRLGGPGQGRPARPRPPATGGRRSGFGRGRAPLKTAGELRDDVGRPWGRRYSTGAPAPASIMAMSPEPDRPSSVSSRSGRVACGVVPPPRSQENTAAAKQRAAAT